MKQGNKHLKFRTWFGKSCLSEEPTLSQKGPFPAGSINDIIWVNVLIMDIRHKLRSEWEEVGVAYSAMSYALLGGTE